MTIPGPVEGSARSCALIDVGAFRENVRAAIRLCPERRLLAVLKANGYGHGAIGLAAAAFEGGAVAVGVSDSGEALELRAAGITGPILILGDLVAREIPSVVAQGITPVGHSEGRLLELEAEAARQGKVIPVHLKVDTGMGRLGMRPDRMPVLAAKVRRSPHLHLQGVMSHLAGSFPAGIESNRNQARAFVRVLERLRHDGHEIRDVHLRNSAGLLDTENRIEGESMGRAGALLYGFDPAGRSVPSGFRPVLSLKTELVFLKDVPAGSPVGYGGTVTTSRPTRLGVIPFGYHDGMKRPLAGTGFVLLRGRRVPIFGQVSMDYTTLDITDVPGARVGDVVTLLGRDGDVAIAVEDVARWANAIAYEVLAGLGRRVMRRTESV